MGHLSGPILSFRKPTLQSRTLDYRRTVIQRILKERVWKRLWFRLWFFSRGARRVALARLSSRAGRRVVVRGHVVPRDVLESPLSGAPCVYYRYLVEEWKTSTTIVPGLRAGLWIATEHDEAIAEFYLEDQGTRAVVAPEGARIETARGVSARPVEVPEGMRATELTIAAGDQIEVEGVVEEAPDRLDEGLGYRHTPTHLVIRAARGGTLRIRLLATGGTGGRGESPQG
jgi:hypothetical protein